MSAGRPARRTRPPRSTRPAALRRSTAPPFAHGEKIDARTLPQPEEITPSTGENDGGHPDAGVGKRAGSREDRSTYHSVTRSIGSPWTVGSEADGAASMMTAFTVGDRLCTPQAVTTPAPRPGRRGPAAACARATEA